MKLLKSFCAGLAYLYGVWTFMIIIERDQFISMADIGWL